MNKNLKLLNILLETELTNRVLTSVVNKWYGDTPTEQNIETAKDYGRKFNEIKNRLVISSPEVITFINRYPNFPTTSLKDITAYSLEQIKHILSDFFEIDDQNTITEIPDIFKGRNLSATEERIMASKQLWYSDNYTIVNEDGFRVYAINNMKEAIMFGFFHGYLLVNSPYNVGYYSQWCITRSIESANLWGDYRSGKGRTFYFVIDESKDPQIESNLEKSKHYISVLQYATDLTANVRYVENLPLGHGYRLTNILNNGIDHPVNKNELLQIYPKLREHLDNIIPKQYSQRELGDGLSIVDRIDEREENPYEFAKVNKRLKKAYLSPRPDNRGRMVSKSISKARSWESMDTGLKQAYFDATERENVFERFSTEELLNKIKSKSSEMASLNRRLNAIGFVEGSYILFKKFFDQNYNIPEKKSKNSSKIVLAKHKYTEKFGLFDNVKADFLVKDGIDYSANYKRKAISIVDNQGKKYIAEVYTKTGNLDDQTNFYYVVPLEQYKELNQGYFMTHIKFTELAQREMDSKIYKEIKLDDESGDLKEIKKGF
jgi:hypothetical protein